MKFKCHECNVQFTGTESLEHCPMCYELCAAEKVSGPNDNRLAGPNAASQPSELVGPNKAAASIEAKPVPVSQAPKNVQKPQPKIANTSVPRARQSLDKPVFKPAAKPVPLPRARMAAVPAPRVRSLQVKRLQPNPPPAVVVLPEAIVEVSSQTSLAKYLRSLSDPVLPVPKRLKRDDVPQEPSQSMSPPPLSNTSVWSKITDESLSVLIGEGNFSFAYALAKRLGTGRSIIATDVEMHHELKDNMFNRPNGVEGGGVCFGKLIELGATVSCRVDVTKLSVTKPLSLLAGSCDFLSWAFPHTRTPNRDVNCIPEHRNLLRAFIDEAAKMLKLGGMALITVKEGYPYNSWDVAGLKTICMNYDGCEPFFPKDFPEYTHVTTVGAPISEITPATTHVFTKAAEPDMDQSQDEQELELIM